MTEIEVAKLFYDQAVRFADNHRAPRTAIAKAQFHASLQIFIDQDGAQNVADWLDREAKRFRDALEAYPAMFLPGGTC
jgi:hypothetical protein